MKITFKPHQKSEIALRVKWLNDPETSQYLVDKPTNTEEQIAWFDKYSKNPSKKFFTIFANNKPVGLVGLKNINPEKKVRKFLW